MINQVIQLTKPKLFEIVTKDIELREQYAIVRPVYLSICRADQRYYNGLRSKSVLNKKLPMALIHEAVGIVVSDPSGKFVVGDKVVLIPNIPASKRGLNKTKYELNEKIGSNYCKDSLFCSSGSDGFLQELVSHPIDLLVKIPEDSPFQLMVLAEMVSVCLHAIRRFEFYSHGQNEIFGVWGDGNLAYILSLLLKYKYPNCKVYVFGKHQDKLEMFSFVDELFSVDQSLEHINITHFFECVGGEMQNEIMNEMIEMIEPGGTISILGVSEQPVSLNLRMVMEKGIVLVGDSRSNEKDFKEAVQILSDSKIQVYLQVLLSYTSLIKNIKQLHEAFEYDLVNSFGKTVISWEM